MNKDVGEIDSLNDPVTVHLACLAAVLGAVPEPERYGEPLWNHPQVCENTNSMVDPVSGSIGGPVRRARNDVAVYEVRNRTFVTRQTHLGSQTIICGSRRSLALRQHLESA